MYCNKKKKLGIFVVNVLLLIMFFDWFINSKCRILIENIMVGYIIWVELMYIYIVLYVYNEGVF